MLRATVQGAALLALIFEMAVYGLTPGIGYLLFWLGAVGVTMFCNRAAERPLHDPWMFVPSLLFAISVMLYDSAVVRVFSSTLGLTSLLWAVAWNLLKSKEPGSLGRLFPVGTFHPARIVSSGHDLWKPLLVGAPECARPCASVLRGVLLAVPLILVFGYLLSSADMIFARALEGLEAQFAGVSLSAPLRTAFWLLLFSAWLKLWLAAPTAEAPAPRSGIGPVEIGVALGSVNLLLLAFLAIQVRYLFGGAALVEALGLNYAEYARKGFFELSACIALILPLVMLAYQSARASGDHRPRWWGGALVLQAGGLAVSAFRRMLLYIDTFGLSVERFYAAAGILVALAVLAWAAYACWHPQEVSWVMARQTVTVLFLLGLLSLVNVEAGICRFNLERAREGGQDLDIEYLGGLSCDAIPAIVEALPELDESQRERLQHLMIGQRKEAGASLGFSWNRSRSLALSSPLVKMDGPACL